MENFSTNLYNKAKAKNGLPNCSKPVIKTHKFLTNKTEQKQTKESEFKLPSIQNISSRYLQPTINKKETPVKNNNKLYPAKGRLKNYTAFLKENYLQGIQLFLDNISLLNFMLACSKFNRIVCENDVLWYGVYARRFKAKKQYDSNRGKWRYTFINSLREYYKLNYENLKNKFLKKLNKTSYEYKKDVYYISNNLFSFLKPIYSLELDGKIYKVKHIFTNKILSHINLFANFDQEFIDLNKLKQLKVNITENNIGVLCKNLLTYDIKKIKFQDLDNFQNNNSKICKIFYNKELTVSTFNSNLVFFFNISIPICKICECVFDFMKGIHDKNLDYFDDIDSKFGYYDYALLINLKSWKNIFYSLNVNTLDFKDYHNGMLYYENDSLSS
jgi:hypothetical protein